MNFTYYRQDYFCKIVYVKLLQFVEEVFHIEQDDDAIDLLSSFDFKLKKAEIIAKITESIESDFFKKLYKVCTTAMNDAQLKPELRIVAAILILLSQTGLRKGELFGIDVQPIQSIITNDKDGRQTELFYIYANIRKNIRGRDTKTSKVKVPLTSDAKQAYLFLLRFCKVRREYIKTKQLIVFPFQENRHKRTVLGYNYANIFYLHFHKELGNINVQERYPELTTLQVKPDMPNMTKVLYSSLVEEYGTDKLVLSYPTFHQYRKTFATMLYQNGHTVEVISKLLHHYSTRITEPPYIRPKFNKKDYATTQKTYDSIIKHKSSVLGKKSADFTKRLQEYIDSDEVASICKTDDELVDYMSKNHPLHAKDVGVCLLSDIYPCTVRSDEERMMCAFNTCPNIGFMFYNLVEHYQKMKNYEKSIELNKREGLELASQKEINRLKYLLKTFLIPELNETAREIEKHGKEQILDWYPEMDGILNELDKIRDEIMSHQKAYEVTA